MPTKSEISEYSTRIENLADKLNIHCLEAMVIDADETGLELGVAASLISTHLKARIKEEATSVNLLKKESQLPL